MKAFTVFLFAAITLTLASCSKTQPPQSLSSPSRDLNVNWNKLDQGDEYVTNLSLPAGGREPIEFAGDNEPQLFIGFKTDAPWEVVKRYLKQIPPITAPVRLEVIGVKSFIGSVAGCGGEFLPQADGKFRFMAVNDTDVPLKIMIYKRKSAPM